MKIYNRFSLINFLSNACSEETSTPSSPLQREETRFDSPTAKAKLAFACEIIYGQVGGAAVVVGYRHPREKLALALALAGNGVTTTKRMMMTMMTRPMIILVGDANTNANLANKLRQKVHWDTSKLQAQIGAKSRQLLLQIPKEKRKKMPGRLIIELKTFAMRNRRKKRAKTP